MCHSSCLTCSAASQLFSGCTSCQTGMTLYSNMCYCDSTWQAQCSSQIALRELLMFLDMFMTIMIIGLMVLYALKVRLPISYRVWSGLNALSIMIYSQAIYLQYEDNFSLKTLAYTNGPYFMIYRIMPISVLHVFPTMVIGICTISLPLLFYFPYQAFNEQHQSLLDYIKQTSFFYFDCFYFFASRMMFMFIGKTINQLINSTVDILPIVIMAIYGIVCILAIVRAMILFHRGVTQSQIYQPPIVLYQTLSPIVMVGICLISSQQLLTIIYCAPLALLILIMLLNRNMKICTKSNIIFYVIQVLFAGVIVLYILMDDTVKTYIIVVLDFVCIIAVLVQIIKTYYGGVDLSNVKVHPEDIKSYQKPNKKTIFGHQEQSQKGGYI